MADDEDDDGHDDACDVCPGIADSQQADTDGDEVGNACDPTPGGNDALDRFMSFATPLDTTRWLSSPDWAQDGDDFAFTGATTYIEYLGTVPAAFELQAQFEITGADRMQYEHVDVIGNNGGGGPGQGCIFFHTMSGEDSGPSMARRKTRAFPGAFSVGTVLTIRGAYRSDITCNGRAVLPDTEVMQGVATHVKNQTGKIAINIAFAQARLRWFAIYALP